MTPDEAYIAYRKGKISREVWIDMITFNVTPVTKKGRIIEERKRQLRMGFTPEHDQQMGIGHVINQAFLYLIRGRFVKSAALIVAAWDVKHK